MLNKNCIRFGTYAKNWKPFLCFQFFLAACELNVCFSTCISNVVYGFSICFYGVLAVPAPPKMQAYMHICSGLVRRGGPM